MMLPTRRSLAALFPVAVALGACVGHDDLAADSADFTSAKAALYDFAFEGELVADSDWPVSVALENQLLYTVGQLNGSGGVGRLDAARIDDVTTEALGGGRTRVRYRAVLPVAWPNAAGSAPSSYTLVLPRDLTDAGLGAFAARYGATCVDLWSAHDVGPGNLWYYYRPDAPNCALEPEDVMRSEALVSRSPDNREDTYPELDRIWQDGLLNAVVVFGKDKVGAKGFADFGIAQYGQFNYRMRWTSFGGLKLAPTPADIPGAPDETIPEVTWTGTFEDGRRIEVHAFVIDNPQVTTPEFEARYAELSRDADVLVYNGHAALGANVHAFARMGAPNPGQYTIVSMMGCDTFAYVDGFMAAQRAELNPDDPQGTKYLDMITNIVPTNPVVLSTASLALIAGVADRGDPQSYLDILRRFETKHHAVVTGDEDNTFRPE